MVTAVDARYQVASGGTAAFGHSVLPAWVPDEGTFANISTNTLYDIRPTGWPTNDIAGPFANWSGGAFASDFSDSGAYVVHGSGHLSAGNPTWAGVWCFDLDTLAWVGRNVPGVPLLENSGDFNAYGESTIAGSLGHTYPPHTYDGLVYQSEANGGGASGALLRVSIAGSPWGSPVHQFDLSSTSAAPTRVVNSIGGTSYPAAAVDEARGGFWYLSGNGTGPLKFVNFDDWSADSTAVGFNEYGDYSLTYIPAPFDCLVATGRTGSGGANMAVYVSPIVGGVPQAFVQVATSGTRVPDARAGTCWSALLDCLVSYEGNGSYDVYKLTPPVGSLTAGTWAWSHETLTAVGGATPSENPVSNNGSWGRFIEVPAARCFIWCDGVTQPVQAWRLTGM